MQHLIMGMGKEQYDQKASSHSKANIFLWVIGGILFNIYKGNLFSVSTLLLIIPGIFIVSFASMITFFVDVKKHQIVPKTNNLFVLCFIYYLVSNRYCISSNFEHRIYLIN